MTRSLLLLGEYNVGKTHFGGQLLGRLNREQGALRMVGTPDALGPFEHVQACLNDGRAAQHTPAAQFHESRWPIASANGVPVELIWPDYGGEQLSSMHSGRQMSGEWRRRVESSDAWIVMVRIAEAHIADDIFSRPLGAIRDIGNQPSPFSMSYQARMVDFLQWLIHIRRSGLLAPIADPQISLLLSCWDELPASQRQQPPARVLHERMPLVSAFIESNWEKSARYITGVSALERALSEESQDDDFIDRGPEEFGYVVLPNGAHDPDLTLAIAPLITV